MPAFAAIKDHALDQLSPKSFVPLHLPRRYLGYAGIIGACLCVSVATLLTKHLVENVPPQPLVFLQLLASAMVIWPAAALTGRLPPRRTALLLALPGLLQPGLVYLFAFAGLAITTANVEGLLFAFETVLVVLLAWPLLRERPKASTLLSATLGTVGVILITGAAPDRTAPVVGVVLILMGVLAAALDTVASRALAINADPLAMAAASHIAGLAIIIVALVTWPVQSWEPVWNAAELGTIALSGILLHGVATILFNYGLSHVEAGPAAALFPSISVFTGIGAYVFLGERLNAPQLTGGALVIGAAFVTARQTEAKH
ncbi:MAG: EamA family transporter [Hyphomicrobiales bacterium]|nr:EamA family transporter [Hyphomicrobiales bacterium]